MSFIGTLIIAIASGSLAGILANRFLQTRTKTIRVDLSVSIFGALCAGLVFYILDVPQVENFAMWNCLATFAGASLLILMLRAYQYWTPV